MLEIKGVSFTKEDTEILKGVDLTVPDGKLFVLTGPNGGGKTTIAKMIAGIEKPDTGSIILDGEDLVPLDPTERAKKGVSFAFQHPVRFKGFTVRDLLDIAAGRTLSDEELTALLLEVGLSFEQYAGRAVDSHLSGGEIKRIEIASVLVRDSKLMVFDEPEAGIDLWSFNSLIRVFEGIRDRRSATLIIISHQERLLSIADELVLINGGKVAFHGPAERMLPFIMKNDCINCPVDEKGDLIGPDR
jgi:Fe-S cluster assembly ATP-binding protein